MERNDSEDSTTDFVQPFSSDSQKTLNRELTYDDRLKTDRPPLAINVDDESTPDKSANKRPAFNRQTTLTEDSTKPPTPSPQSMTIGANTAHSLRNFARKFSMSPVAQQQTASPEPPKQTLSLGTEFPSSPMASPEPPNTSSNSGPVHLLARTQSQLSAPPPASPYSFQATAGSLSYIKSFFRRRPLLQSQMSTDSTQTTTSLPAIPEPESPPPFSPSIHTLSDVTEKDLEQLFPRVPKRPGSIKGQ